MRNVLNYRPTFNLHTMKGFGEDWKKTIVGHLERRNFITYHQHGFRVGKMCLTDLIEFHD